MKACESRRRETPRLVLVRHESRIAPYGLAVFAPKKSQRPSRQRFAGIPFALPVVEKAARREAVTQTPDQIVGAAIFFGAERRRGPLGAVHVVDRNKRRLAADREAHIARFQVRVHLMAERFDLRATARRCRAW